MKYIVVTGGVFSDLGKGVTASSIGLLMKGWGQRVTHIKIDPYLNIDAGLMSPYEHGEVFVLDDGAEADLDLGNYERFTGIVLSQCHNLTSGKMYNGVIQKERRGEYLGKTVQIIPHLTDYILECIETVAKIPVDSTALTPEICIIEVGGTVGDIEGLPFIKALVQLKKKSKQNVCFVHVSPILTLPGNKLKTKPTQRALESIASLGITPDILCLRSDSKILDFENIKRKIDLNCGVLLHPENFYNNYNVDSIYSVPDLFHQQGMDVAIMRCLGINAVNVNLDDYYRILSQIEDVNMPTVTIAIIGKYTNMKDTYLSVTRALEHASFKVKRNLQLVWIESAKLENLSITELNTLFTGIDGIVVPGGFGGRGVEGMIVAVKHARTHKIPCLGICLGMQVQVIELARSLMGWHTANSTEFDAETSHPIIKLSSDAVMRLGSKKVVLQGKTLELYTGCTQSTTPVVVQERHRHRYETNSELYAQLNEKCHDQIKIGGLSPEGLIEIIEHCDKTQFWIGAQFHPEYKSSNDSPHWLFVGLLNAAIKFNCV